MARTWSAELAVVGLKFRTKALVRDILAKNVPFKVELQREPDNKIDPNAIMVMVGPRFKVVRLRGIQIGYLSRGAAEKLAPLLDAGTTTFVSGTVHSVDVMGGEATATFRFRDADKPKTRGRK